MSSPGWPFLSPPHCPFSLEAVQLGPCSGLLVDWLEMLDPEVISSCPDPQQRLLFSQGKVGCAPHRGPMAGANVGVVGAGLPWQPLRGQSLSVGFSRSLGLLLAWTGALSLVASCCNGRIWLRGQARRRETSTLCPRASCRDGRHRGGWSVAPHLDGSPKGPVGPCGEGLGVSETPNHPPVSPSLLGAPVAGGLWTRPQELWEQELGTWVCHLHSRALAVSEELVRVSTRCITVCPGWAPRGPRAARAASQAGALGLSGNGPLPLLSSGSRPGGPSAPQGPSLVCFLPRAKVILAPRCHLSDPTCWPCSLTSPAGPHCISVSASCWARTGSRGEHPSPHPSPQARRHGGSIGGPSGHVAQRSPHRHPGTGSCIGHHHRGDTEGRRSTLQMVSVAAVHAVCRGVHCPPVWPAGPEGGQGRR